MTGLRFPITKWLLICGVASLVFLFTPHAQAATIRDTDMDGIADEAEVLKYKTNPNSTDTDKDGFSDLVEVLNKSDPINAANNPVLNIKNKKVKLIDRRDPVMWYVARISGITAFILFSFVITFGLIQSSKSLLKFRLMNPNTAMEIHRAIAWSGLFMLLLHIGSLILDDYIKLKISEALIPFVLKREFLSAGGYDLTLGLALGIVAMYLILVLVVSSEFRNKIVSIKIWRIIHYISFAGYILFLIHGYITGTDSKEPWMITIYALSLIMNAGLLVGRIFKKQLFYPKPKVQKSPTMPQSSQGI